MCLGALGAWSFVAFIARADISALATLLAIFQADLTVQIDLLTIFQADLSVQDDLPATLQADLSVQDTLPTILQADLSVQYALLATYRSIFPSRTTWRPYKPTFLSKDHILIEFVFEILDLTCMADLHTSSSTKLRNNFVAGPL